MVPMCSVAAGLLTVVFAVVRMVVAAVVRFVRVAPCPAGNRTSNKRSRSTRAGAAMDD